MKMPREILRTALSTVLLCGLCYIQAQGQYFLGNGASALGNDCFQLTSGNPNQHGQVWHNQQISLAQPFEIYATLFFGPEDTLGGDGIGFLFHQAGLLAAGPGVGNMGFGGIAPSLAIEFDTDRNAARGDPLFDHVALMRNGSTDHTSGQNLVGPVSMGATNPNVEDSADHMVHIRWDPISQELRVWFDCELRILYQGDIVAQFFAGFPNVYWGFTGGTSALSNQQTVCIEYTNLDPPLADTTLCQGVPLQLSVGFGQEYVWSPAAGLNDDSIANPIATPSQTTQYTVTVSDSCGQSRTHTYLHTIIDSNTLVMSGDSITCAGIPVPLRFALTGTAPFSVDVTDGAGTVTYNLDSNGNDLVTGMPIMVTPGATTTYTPIAFSGQGTCGTAFSGSANIILDILNNMIVNVQNTTCFGFCNGAASIFLPHANPDFTYVWPDLTSGSSRSGLCAGSYMVTVSNGNGCTDSVQLTVQQPNQITLAPLPNLTACRDEAVNVTATAAGGSGTYTYTWSDGVTGPSNTLVDTITRTYSVTVTDDNNCPPATQTFTITRTPALTLTTQVDTGLCNGETITITVQASGGDGTYGFAWSDGSNGNNFIDVDPDTTTTYTVTLTDGCGSPPQIDSILVVVDDYATHTYTLSDPACVKDLIRFDIDDFNPDYRYDFWFGDGSKIVPGEGTFYHQYPDTGCYDVVMRIQTRFCDSIRTDTCPVNIQVSPDASFTVDPGALLTISDFTATFTNTTPTSVAQTWFIDNREWSSGDPFVFDFVDSGTYDVTLTTLNALGCGDTVTQQVFVEYEFPAFFIPNAFTPNGDGDNETFGPVILERDLTDYKFVILDRWGQEVFQTGDPDQFWDGTKNNGGGRAAQGVYIYIIKYLNRTKVFQEHSGEVLLYR